MLAISKIDKVAVLLDSFAPVVSATLLDVIGPPRNSQLTKLMRHYSRDPDINQMIEEVIQEFVEATNVELPFGWFDVSNPEKLAAVQRALEAARATAKDATAGTPGSNAGDRKRIWQEVGKGLEESDQYGRAELGSDPIAELRELDLNALTIGLGGERPSAVAIALNNLEVPRAVQLLRRMPMRIRRQMFVQMADGVPDNGELNRRIVESIVQRCTNLTPDEIKMSSEAHFQHMADVLQMVDRKDRDAMIESLLERNPELAERVKGKLFVFEDLLKLDDRSIQRLLPEMDQRVLALALSDAPDAVLQRVLENLPERLREAVKSEITFLGAVAEHQVDAAKREITEVLRGHEAVGALQWTS